MQAENTADGGQIGSRGRHFARLSFFSWRSTQGAADTGLSLSRNLFSFAALAVTLTVSFAAALPARAQDDRARLHFQAGASYYEAGDYEDALREFQRSQALSERSELFYNFSLCYQQLGDLENAAVYLRRYLDEVETIDNREQLERRHANLLERVAAAEAGTPDPQIDPDVDDPASEGQGDADAATPEPSSADADADAPAAAPRRGVPAGAIIGYAAAGVGVVLAVTFGPLALRERGRIADGCGATRSCAPRDVQQMDGFALATDIGLVMAVAGATVGTVLLFTGRDDTAEAPRDQARVRFTPYASPMGAGATLRGTF
jgi:tetratricopeptide (TPR) repeat protein